MSPKLQPVRGTHDILPEEFERFHAVVHHARELAALYGFKEMSTPIFEMTEVFSRSMGETSDVVSKEMFTFDTRGGESVTLRPEFTAGIVRSFISNGMQQHLPLKLFSTGPLFRYERPQKGRQRQFHQVNFEWLGDASAEADAEIILLAGHLLYSLSGKACTLLINTLGDKESRTRYREALVSYLAPHAAALSEDSRRRLTENPLRILDSKDENDRKILADAPKITDYLSAESKTRFEQVCNYLNGQNIPLFQEVRVSPALVRGLDYYTDTVFEFVDESGGLGAQNTVLAGGRYDGLIEQMGGKPTPAIGFAAGVERLLLLTEEGVRVSTQKDISVKVIPFEEVAPEFTFVFATQLRLRLQEAMNACQVKQRSFIEILWQGKLSKRLEKAAKTGATHAIILAPDEVKAGQCAIKDMQSGEQKTVALSELTDAQALKSLFNMVR